MPFPHPTQTPCGFGALKKCCANFWNPPKAFVKLLEAMKGGLKTPRD
jgi:hypothetical protein